MAAAVPSFFLFFLLCTLKLSHSLTENEALLKLKSSLTNAGALDSWVSGSPPCASKWIGVICSDVITTGLHLSDLGLSGTINIEALQELRGLRTISFNNNSFSGPIPEFNKLGALKSLLLSQNAFSGEIPNDFFSTMSSLKKVWLDGNRFTGTIPESVMQLPHLMELHLEGNQFSGTIPSLKQPKLVTSLDLSDNNLEGKIPESFSSFGAKSFQGNDKLCGKPLDMVCSSIQNPERPVATVANQPSSSNGVTAVGVFVVVVIGCIALGTLCLARRRQDDLDHFSVLDSESVRVMDEPPSEASTRPSESSRKGGGGSTTKRGSQQSRNGVGDLIMVNHEKGTFGMADLMKAAAEVLGNGALGSAYKATMNNGLAVVVKRMREMNTFAKEDFEAEMRRFGRIKHRNILTPLAYHYRKEEKLLVSEYMPKGSLLYVLHGDRGICHSELTWPTRLKIILGIGRGLGYLHSEYSSYTLPHGNLKSSNVLLSSNYEPLLSDYALDPLTNPSHASQVMFAYKSPEYIQFQQVSPKSDVYCFGIIILEVVTGKFPSQYLSNGKGGTDVVQWALQKSSEGKVQELIDPEITSNTTPLDPIVQLLQIGVSCIESNPTQRLDLREALRRIEDLNGI